VALLAVEADRVSEESKSRREAEPTLLRDVMYVTFKRKFPLITLFALGVLIIAYGSVGQKPEYEARARVLVQRLRASYAMPSATSAVLRRSDVINSEIQIVRSSAVAAEVVDRLDLAQDRSRAQAITALESGIKATPLPEADVIDITFRHRDPERAALVVNTALDAYLEIRAKIVLNQHAVDYLANQAQQAKAVRDSIMEEIAALGAETGDINEGLLSHLKHNLKSELWADQATLETNIRRREAQLTKVREWLHTNTDYTNVPTGDIYAMGTVQRTYQALIEVHAELADATARYTDEHPEVMRLKREIASMELLLREEVERAVSREEMRLFELRAEKQAVDGLLGDLDAEDAQLAWTSARRRSLESDFKIRDDVYETILERAEEYRVTAAVDPSIQNVSVVSRAEIPAVPTPRPVNMKIVVGAFTIIFGILLVYGLERADHTLERREDVHRFLGVKVLASVPERT